MPSSPKIRATAEARNGSPTYCEGAGFVAFNYRGVSYIKVCQLVAALHECFVAFCI
jgi:hypothetical protein